MLGSGQFHASAASPLRKDPGASSSNIILCFNCNKPRRVKKDVFVMASASTAEVFAIECRTKNNVTWFCRGHVSTPPNIETKLVNCLGTAPLDSVAVRSLIA